MRFSTPSHRTPSLLSAPGVLLPFEYHRGAEEWGEEIGRLYEAVPARRPLID